MKAKVRLYVDHPLGAGQTVGLSREQAHYLFAVMRLEVGEGVLLFNGEAGEWLAEVIVANKRNPVLECRTQTGPQVSPPDLWLLFAPIKKARTDFIVEKATEMGARRIVPVLTEFTNAERVKVDRLQAHAVEAAEQCGGTFVPKVAEPVKLANFLDAWPQERSLMFCNESLVGEDRKLGGTRGPWAVLIGPEGGFSDAERERLSELPQAHAVSLGPRILRADTAAVAALTVWQSTHGDWQ
ncbi:16S rRNA (uracil(1498)-N(3))-methyltransferase [Vannielia litorea]|uniref:16S rRNA (uracil(1498)-N(3))-methyltransferase n=1 Tax=Vannielia litorea TaxID=1217970 RepID=UPI001C962F31|nr:16S rRNA (uracil(1498)-N(3))-methyltransferase [Vannielia litorea]MBY6154919.1 16S rRNA (uracil(1498)-N(3))-methyltransferase [Vannielia litorea]